MPVITVAELVAEEVHELDLKILVGREGLNRRLAIQDVNRPGLALAGYLDYFAHDRVQVLGNTEIHYMEQLPLDILVERVGRMMEYEIPCFVVSRGLVPRKEFLDMASRMGISVLSSQKNTSEVISNIIVFLSDCFSPETTLHGTVTDVFGVGVLLRGSPGVGKSETALELVERGHRLVADDVIIVKRRGERFLYARGSEVIGHHMEIRGIGIINVHNVFGVGSIRQEKRIDLIADLEEWDSSKEYDRTGIEEEWEVILAVRVPKVTIPVRPGRNLAIIVEVAALNQRLKMLGTYSARELNQRLIERMSGTGDAL